MTYNKITKTKITYINLLTDLIHTTDAVLDEMHLAVKDLQFAVYNSTGTYTFLPKKDIAWNALNTIAAVVAKRHPDYRQGEVVDILAELVNTTIQDELSKRGIPIARHIVDEEEQFLHALLLDAYKVEYLVFFPWLKPIAQLSQSSWQAKDLCKDVITIVKKKIKGNFVQYKN